MEEAAPEFDNKITFSWMKSACTFGLLTIPQFTKWYSYLRWWRVLQHNTRCRLSKAFKSKTNVYNFPYLQTVALSYYTELPVKVQCLLRACVYKGVNIQKLCDGYINSLQTDIFGFHKRAVFPKCIMNFNIYIDI